jgi:hypothetical protein
MGCVGALLAAGVTAVVLTGCGGTPATATLGARTLAAGELPGFNPAKPIVVTNPQTWVGVEELKPAQGAILAARLRRLGFVGAAREDLSWAKVTAGAPSPPAAALSVVEQFSSAAAARTELAAELPSLQPGTPITVPGVPGARGYDSSANGSEYANIVFAAGPYLYLVGAEWQTGLAAGPSPAGMIAAVQHLYRRVGH